MSSVSALYYVPHLATVLTTVIKQISEKSLYFKFSDGDISQLQVFTKLIGFVARTLL